MEAWHDRGDRMMIGKLEHEGAKLKDYESLFELKQLVPSYEIRRYWKKKSEDPLNFHPQSHGGARHVKFGPNLRNLLKYALLMHMVHSQSIFLSSISH